MKKTLTSEEAISIATKEQNLKYSFLKLMEQTKKEYYGYLRFDEFETKLVEINGKKAWKIAVIKCYYEYIKGITIPIINKFISILYSDGLYKGYQKELACLVYLDTKEYEYIGDKDYTI